MLVDEPLPYPLFLSAVNAGFSPSPFSLHMIARPVFFGEGSVYNVPNKYRGEKGNSSFFFPLKPKDGFSPVTENDR